MDVFRAASGVAAFMSRRSSMNRRKSAGFSVIQEDEDPTVPLMENLQETVFEPQIPDPIEEGKWLK